MKKIDKFDIKELLVKNLNLQTNNIETIDIVVDDIFDLEKNIVYPLTELETFVLRKRFGILDNGKIASKVSIANIINMSPQSVSRFFSKAMLKLVYYIRSQNEKDKIVKMTSIDNLDNIDEFKNMVISAFNIDTTAKNRLAKNNIITVYDLMSYSKIELRTILGEKNFEDLVNIIHSFDIYFLDELNMSSKIEIVLNSNIDIINNSSIYWLFDLEKIDKSILSYVNAKTIKEYFEIIDTLPIELKRKILNNMLPYKYHIIDMNNSLNEDTKINK